ncbi:MAG: hypothetical protein IT323_04675 [Anaerolineae bacterium]|nr:hypothetical protein [Anaerolineae bacterium]
MRPTFTLLIHARGRPDLETLAATLASLRFTLTRDDVECLALADGGDARIAALLRAEPGIGRVLVPARPCGVIAARTALLERARGRFAVLITTPARFTDSAWLDRLARALAHEDTGMAGPCGARIDYGWQSFTPVTAGRCDVLTGGPWAIRRDALQSGATLDPLDLGEDGRVLWPDAEQALRVRELGYAVRCTGHIGASDVRPDAPEAAAWAALRARWAGRGLVRAEEAPHPWPADIPRSPREEAGNAGITPTRTGVGTRPASSASASSASASSPLSTVLRGEGSGVRPVVKEYTRWRERA